MALVKEGNQDFAKRFLKATAQKSLSEKRSERWKQKVRSTENEMPQAQIPHVLGSILDGKLLNLLVSRLEAKIESKIEEPENKFQKIKDEIKEFKEDVNDSINHVEHVLRN